MFFIIQDKNNLIKIEVTNYYKYKGITIYKDSDFYFSLSEGFYFLNHSFNSKISINKYEVYYDDNSEPISIYVYDSNKGLNDFNIYENMDFIIKKNDSLIVTKDLYLLEYNFELSKGIIYTDYKDLLVNHKHYHQSLLKSGDYIEYLGFSFFYYEDFLYMNSFNVDIHINKKEESSVIVYYNNQSLLTNNYYESPKKGLKIDKIDVFEPPRIGSSRKLILQVGPTITMSLAMIMMCGISIYNNYLNNGSYISSISLLIMPITMLISGIMWPAISSSSEKRAFNKEYKIAKQEYLNYLKEYDLDLENRIKAYLKEESINVFNVDDIKNRLFYINKKSKEFLKITLGYQKISYELEIKDYKDNDINEYINRIKYRLRNIDNCPLYLDLKENKKVTIIGNNRLYLLNRIILELISKYHYDDLNVGVFAKDGNVFNNLFNIPHLFNKNKRYTINEERQLQDLNNTKLSKPFVLILYDYTEYEMSNQNIHVILLSKTNKELLKNSDCIVELFNNKGTIHTNEKIEFTYYEEAINFKKYYDYISLANNTNKRNDIISFSSVNPRIDIKENYLNNHNGLLADFAVINNEILSFDLHESKQGPHGLIGGSTGSGKSELIVSMLLSLAIRYSPDYLNIILIDYKGGGIKESLSYNSLAIPHIIAAINNLENDVLERLIVAIERECKHRQLLFKELANKSLMSIMNIDEYMEVNKEYKLENIAHLLIVVDEFAELKKENPYIIKQLISFSRIGRSLGIHLILATQRPSGVIDDEIWSNSHFKIALKVHSEKDSMDIIKKNDAAYLNSPGEFYLQVDDNTIKAKSLYTKKDINNNDQYEVALLNSQLDITKRKTYKKNNIIFESSYYTHLIIEATKELGLKQKVFEYSKPNSISRKDLANKYLNSNQYILGEVDNYLEAKKSILEYPLNENILIYTNRKNEINNIINCLYENKITTIVISNIKYQSAYISDSLLYEDEDDINYLLNKLLNDSEAKITMLIEDLNILFSYDEEYINMIYQLIRRSSISNYSLVLLTNQSNINFKILNSVKNKVVIYPNDNQDLINIFSTKNKYHGDAYFFKDEVISYVPCVLEDIKIEDKIVSNYILPLPNVINYEYTRDHLLIGFDCKTRKEIYLSDSEELLISSYDPDLINKYRYLFVQNSNIKVMLYSNELIKHNYQNILWLQDGLLNQRLFFIDKELKLGLNEAYLFKANKGRVIRPVNHE